MNGLTLTAAVAATAPSLVPYGLRVENLVDPLALQTEEPRFSWKVRAGRPDERNLKQTAYRILVASSPDRLTPGKADLWDSGKVTSAATFGVRYAGKDLGSRAFCWWKVQVWDQDGKAARWSPAARFSTGLLGRNDWRADWIHGNKPTREPDPLEGARWVWGSDYAGDQTPAGSHRFAVKIDYGSQAARAVVVLTVDNLWKLRVNGTVVAEQTDLEAWRRPTQVDLLAHLRTGENVIEIEGTNVGVGPAGLLAGIEIERGGKVERYVSGPDWLADGAPVRMIGDNGIQPWGPIRVQQIVPAPAQYLRKEFVARRKVKRATLYATALGNVDFHLNGKRVSDDLFTPGWTNYRKRVQYRAWDVTRQVRAGDNALGAVLAQGWYAGYIAWGWQREHWGDTPQALAQLEIEYDDGLREIVVSDKSWRTSEGPILDEHHLHGEKYDARREQAGWDRPRFRGANWKPVGVAAWPEATVEAFIGNPVREYAEVKPVSVKEIRPSTYLVDFGQNLSGFVRLTVSAKRGTVITLKHAERLDADGLPYYVNLRSAQATDVYTAKGAKRETWNPRFTFHGFQYVEVSGLTEPPNGDTLRAVAISSATPEVGTLETSDAMLNTLVRNAWWTQKMNFIDVPTDCPQRDERLGWTGDAQAYIRTAASLSDVQAFFTKWLVSLDDDQREDGQYPMVAPVLKTLEDGGPAWADAGVICPMAIYHVYGDLDLLRRHYPQMRKFIEFCRARSKPDLTPPDQFHCFGDWLNIGANTPNDVIFLAYFAGSTALLVEAAEALGYADDAAKYRDLHGKLRKAFQNAYVRPDGKVKGETQCSYVLALGFDLLEETQRDLAAKHLVADIESRGWHLSTGFVGTRDLMHVVSKIGRDDVAFRLLHNKTFPSWGFTIQHGATSIWERWDGWTPDKGFQDPGMNSFAHYAYGAVVGWMFEHIGGIRESEPGYGKMRIEPKIDPNLAWAKCTYDSVRGPIRTSWKVLKGKVDLEVEVPANAEAEIVLPNGKVEKVGSGVWRYTVDR